MKYENLVREAKKMTRELPAGNEYASMINRLSDAINTLSKARKEVNNLLALTSAKLYIAMRDIYKIRPCEVCKHRGRKCNKCGKNKRFF